MEKLKSFLKHIYGNRFSGEFSSNKKGDGYDLEDIKEYQIGDNIKKINWKLSAKYDKEYISIYKQEKEPILDIFIDLSINISLFKQELKNYLMVLKLLIKQLGIKHNIYLLTKTNNIFSKKTVIKKIKQFDNIDFENKSSSSINSLFNFKEFKQNNYKLIISDYSFLEQNLMTNFNNFYNKLFFAIVPIYNILENHSFPILNGYFDSNINQDYLKVYKETIKKLNFYGITEEI